MVFQICVSVANCYMTNYLMYQFVNSLLHMLSCSLIHTSHLLQVCCLYKNILSVAFTLCLHSMVDVHLIKVMYLN